MIYSFKLYFDRPIIDACIYAGQTKERKQTPNYTYSAHNRIIYTPHACVCAGFSKHLPMPIMTLAGSAKKKKRKHVSNDSAHVSKNTCVCMGVIYSKHLP